MNDQMLDGFRVRLNVIIIHRFGYSFNQEIIQGKVNHFFGLE